MGRPTLLLKGTPSELTLGCSTAGFRLARQVIVSVLVGQEKSLGDNGPREPAHGVWETLCSILAAPAGHPRRPEPPG